MTAVFADSTGIKRNFLWQYDKGQTLVLENLEYEVSPEVHFTTSSADEALVSIGSYKDGTLKVAVPNALLLEARKITVYLYIDSDSVAETVKTIDINVRPRKRPSDYMFSDGVYMVSFQSIQDAIGSYINANSQFVEDIVVDYTTVHLIDDTTGIEYMVGINGGKLYIKEVTANG